MSDNTQYHKSEKNNFRFFFELNKISERKRIAFI